MIKHKLTIFIGCILLFCGCAPIFFVRVNSISTPQLPSDKTYFLFSGQANVTESNLQFMEYSRYVENALRERGFKRVAKPELARLAIFLAYGIGAPQTHLSTETNLAWGKVGATAVTTSYSPYTSTTRISPDYGLTTETEIVEHTTYARYITLLCMDILPMIEQGKEVELWRTDLVSTGTSDDLRRVFPVMITAGMNYFAENSGKKITVDIEENAPWVLHIKKENPPCIHCGEY